MRKMSTLLLAASAAATLAIATAPASAYEIDGDIYRADSSGNLIIYSASGYKRIIVGKGHLLAQYQAEHAVPDPDVVYYDDERPVKPDISRCRVEPGMFKGRSYMYGLPDGVVPSPARRVCD